MNFFQLVKTILDVCKSHDLVQEVHYGDIYEFENSGSRKYMNVVLTITQASQGDNITTYSFNLFATDRLTDDKGNKLAVQSVCKTTLTQIMEILIIKGITLADVPKFTFWTEKFNDLCAGCYASFSVSVPNEAICGETEDYNPQQTKSVTLTKNGDYTVTPDSGYEGLSRVNIEVDVSFPLQDYLDNGGKFGFSTWKKFPYNFGGITLPTSLAQLFYNCTSLQTLDVSGWDVSKVENLNSLFYNCSSLQTLDVSGWDVSKISTITGTFRNIKISELDLVKWKADNVSNVFNGSTTIKTIIGDYTLEEVESGEVVCFGGATSIDLDGLTNVRYASILACLNGMNNLSGRLWLKTNSFNNCYNDDDTVPDSTTLAERQATIKALCAEKNKNLQLG